MTAPVEATEFTAAAKYGSYPAFFIKGIIADRGNIATHQGCRDRFGGGAVLARHKDLCPSLQQRFGYALAVRAFRACKQRRFPVEAKAFQNLHSYDPSCLVENYADTIPSICSRHNSN